MAQHSPLSLVSSGSDLWLVYTSTWLYEQEKRKKEKSTRHEEPQVDVMLLQQTWHRTYLTVPVMIREQKTHLLQDDHHNIISISSEYLQPPPKVLQLRSFWPLEMKNHEKKEHVINVTWKTKKKTNYKPVASQLLLWFYTVRSEWLSKNKLSSLKPETTQGAIQGRKQEETTAAAG